MVSIEKQQNIFKKKLYWMKNDVLIDAPYGNKFLVQKDNKVRFVITPDGTWLRPWIAHRGSSALSNVAGLYTPEQFKRKLYNKTIYLIKEWRDD